MEARARAGASWSTLNASLIAIRTALEGSPRLRDASALTVAAQRHLSDLFYAGMFDPGFQAPILCVWQVVAMIEAAEPRDAFLVAVTYLAGLRPAEWTLIDLEHFEIRRGRVTMLLPDTKTGPWQKVTVKALPGTPFNLAALAQAWLNERGDAPGPLICEPNGDRLGDEHIKYALRSAAAAAGVTAFSPYSLRRSLAVHADLLGVPGPVIRQRLRHAPESQVYRRYIEPMLALFDRDGAKALYLDSKPGTGGRVPVNEVRAGTPLRNFRSLWLPGLSEYKCLELPGFEGSSYRLLFGPSTCERMRPPMRLLTAPTRALINKLLGTRHTSPAPTPDPHTTAPRDKHRHRPTHKLDLSDCECRRPPF